MLINILIFKYFVQIEGSNCTIEQLSISFFKALN